MVERLEVEAGLILECRLLDGSWIGTVDHKLGVDDIAGRELWVQDTGDREVHLFDLLINQD